MEKFKQIYEDGKIFMKDEPILFVNPYTEQELQKINLFKKPTIFYNDVKGFKENIKFINTILKRKIKVISFKSEILVHIKSIRKIKKSTIGIYSEDTFVDKEKLADVYNLDISNLPSYFKNYQNPLIILDATDDTDIVEILKNRKDYPTFLLSSDNTNILQHLVLEDYTDNTCIFKKCCISNYLLNKKERIKRFFGMEEEETDGYLVYFGCFEDKDYNKIMSFDGVVFLYWFGMDCNINNKKVRKMLKSLSKKSNIIHFVFSENLRDVLMKYGIQSRYVKFNIVEKKLFKPVMQKGYKIFVHNGCKRGYVSEYGDYIYRVLQEEMPEYEFIFSNRQNISYEKMRNVYGKCFIGLRLTNFDGYTNMVEEMQLMNIPVVHNFSDYGLKWKTIEDVKKHILKYSPPTIKYNHQYKFDLFNDNFANEDLPFIYKNIDEFGELIRNYRNILFVGVGNPLKDGEASIFYKIGKFYEENHDINKIFVNEKRRQKPDYVFLQSKEEIKNYIKELDIDLVIVKGAIGFNMKCILQKPVINMVGSLYRDDLDRYYYEDGSEQFLNWDVIKQIEYSDLSFVNSSHVMSILKELGYKSRLFYWNFVPYYGRCIPEKIKWNRRKYEYGIICDNFNKKIKNADKIIEQVNGKSCLLVGENSRRFEKKNVTFEEYVEPSKMWRQYAHIKFVLIDSFFDSCSNVKVEALMYGCKTEIKNNVSLMDGVVKLRKGQKYVISFGKCVLHSNLKYGISFLEGFNDKEMIIYYLAKETKEVTIEKIIKDCEINYEIVGYNTRVLGEMELERLYYWYGMVNVRLEFLGLEDIFRYYESGVKFNVDLMKRKYLYELGKSGKELDMENFAKYVLDNESNIITKKCLVLSKRIRGYGGNQKTAMQLIKMLERYYIVEVISVEISDMEFNWQYDYLHPKIHNMKIVKKKRESEVVEHINRTDYDLIVNNKYDGILRIIDRIDKKAIVISHNSMDPFNKIILDHQDKFSKVLTINKFHQRVLKKHGLKLPVGLLYNYIGEEDIVERRDVFRGRISYVGRLSKEKNVDLLLDAFRRIEGISLVVIGDGDMERVDLEGVEWRGRMDWEGIRGVLRESDYLVLPSYTEGLPFVILEAMNMGIPCIYSDINGARELIGDRGFLFKLRGYYECRYRMDWGVYESVDRYREENLKNLEECIRGAYRRGIKEWNRMSRAGGDYVRRNYMEGIVIRRNMSLLGVK